MRLTFCVLCRRDSQALHMAVTKLVLQVVCSVWQGWQLLFLRCLVLSCQHCSLKLFALLNPVAPSMEVSCPVSLPCRTLFLWSSGGIQGWCTDDHIALCFHPYLDSTLSGHCNLRGFRRPVSVLCLCGGGQPRGRVLGTLVGDTSLLAQLSLPSFSHTLQW